MEGEWGLWGIVGVSYGELRCEDGTVAANFQLASSSHFGNPRPRAVELWVQ